MRIRTRYKLFKALIVLGLLTFAFSLYDMFLNNSGFFIPVMIAYAVFFLAGVLLYLGYKPSLDEEGMETQVVYAAPAGAPPPPAAEAEAVEVVEVPKRRQRVAVNVAGPHHFKCPFCSNVFGLEATHLEGRHDFRMNCPYCANNIRVPRQPKVTAGPLGELRLPSPGDQVLMTCINCGEVLRFTAPGSALERFLHVQLCPYCRRPGIVTATA